VAEAEVVTVVAAALAVAEVVTAALAVEADSEAAVSMVVALGAAA
jgi:hypothetical protein